MENKTTQNSIKTAENLDQAKEYLIKMPPHSPINIPKDSFPILPKNFQKTILGYSKKGELAQYRGANCIHVHEFSDKYELHRDLFDPRDPIGVIGHAFADAPEIGFGVTVGLISGAVIGKLFYDSRKDNSENAALEGIPLGGLLGFGFGLISFLAIRRIINGR
jgi:hypothetical protein